MALNLSELVNRLGNAKRAASNAYETYKELKGFEDQARWELESTLRAMELRSAKGKEYTVSIAEKPTVVIKHEQSVIEYLREEPGIEEDLYIGVKPKEFQSLAKSMLKNTGEVIPGTEVEVRESLSIRANKKGK